MATNNHSFLMILVFVAAAWLSGVSTASFRSPGARYTRTGHSSARESVGPFVALNPRHPYVVELAKFAVEEYKMKACLAKFSYSHVYEAAVKDIGPARNFFALVIAVDDETGMSGYYANLFIRGDVKQLVTFRGRE